MTSLAPKPARRRWITYVVIGTLISFVALDLLIVVTGTRVLAQSLQPVAPAGTAAANEAAQLECRYFDGTGLVMVPISSAEPGHAPECPLLLPAAGKD